MLDQSFVTATKDFVTIIDFIRYGISRARAAGLCYGHGTDNEVDDIFALVIDSLNLPWDLDKQWLHGRLTVEEHGLLTARLAQRIVHRVPVPYLTHVAHYFDTTFYVDDRVLIPRSPIAELIRQQFSPWIEADSVTRIMDLCTGSACMAIACCQAFPDAQVDALDLSADALAVAAINVERHQVQDQLTLIQSDCWDQAPARRYDIIISNPPYVSAEDVVALPAEYHHEPVMALEASEQGLGLVRRILQQAQQFLQPDGILVVEVGLSEDALVEAYPELPFIWLEFEHGGSGVFLLRAQDLATIKGQS